MMEPSNHRLKFNGAGSSRSPLPPYILERIRRGPPANCCVVDRSTPVLAFGDLFSSHAATLGLNPSSREFLDEHGQWLDEDERRLETLDTLRLDRLSNASDEQAGKIHDACAKYFTLHPFGWFKPLEQMLNAVGASYYKGSACHLDLVQWATWPKWSDLKRAVQEDLLAADVSFLAEQLKQEGIRFLLLNGRGVVKRFCKTFSIELSELESLREHGYQRTRLFTGIAFERVLVIGWSTNLQSSHGVMSARRDDLATRISEIASKYGADSEKNKVQ